MNAYDLLKDKGISPSQQRIKILDFLIKNRTHPSVDDIYNSLIGDIPTLSKTTVYNTLSLFREKSLIRVVHDETEIRYDAGVELHGHFKCNKCGNIYDFPISEINYPSDKLTDFQILEKHVYFNGICSKCITKGDNNGDKT